MNEADKERLNNRLELCEAVLLSLAVLATAWCAYQSTLWSGIQTFRLAESNAKSRLAAQRQLLDSQRRLLDGNIIMHFVDAVVDKRTDLRDFYLHRVHSELRDALQAWLDTNPLENREAPAHPGAMPEFAKVLKQTDAEFQKLHDEAMEILRSATEANHNADNYVLLTVLFASVLCFVGLSGKFDPSRIRVGLIVLATLIFFTTLAMVLLLPLANE